MTIDEAPLPPAVESTAVIDLDHADALDVRLVGGKAAALAKVRRAGIATLPAAVLSTAMRQGYDAGRPLDAPAVDAALDAVLGRLGADRALVARSSSVVEDGVESSKAGQFESVLDVTGRDELRAAVETVYLSRGRAGAADEPIAVLVQPLVDPEVAGVFFGVDPVAGRTDRRVVTAVRGTPDGLVSGEVDGSRWLLDEAASVIDEHVDGGVTLTPRQLRSLVDLGDRLAEVFGGPQDVEWGIVDGDLVVLQSRPVTTEVNGVPSGPVFGPGPVAETFPEALSPLEIDLWVDPLRDGLREALRISGAVRTRELEDRALVITIDGQVAIDLEVTGEIERSTSFGERMGGRVRRLRSAWRIGRLRVALPALAHDLCDRADDDLEHLPAFDELAMRQLVALVGRGQLALRSLHAHEILMGLVSGPTSSAFTGASVALRVLAESRRDGLSDEEIVRRAPVVLALVPPRVERGVELPAASTAGDLRREAPEAAAIQVSREALRLRVRWMQELVGQAAYEIGRRLVAREELDAAEQVGYLRWDDLAAVASRQATVDRGGLGSIRAADASIDPWPVEPADASSASGPDPTRPGRVLPAIVHRPASLPARFQVSDRGRAVAVVEPGQAGGGTGAGGGTARGAVTHDVDDPPAGSILVVGSLTPQLGPKLDRLAGIVAETGSVLSHLAILARESGVATVVGHRGALQELAEGTVVTVDGGSGQVTKDVDAQHLADGAVA